MALEITGKIVKILPEQSGAGKNGTWTKQEFVIETTEQYPKKICCSAWGDKVSIKNFSMGDSIKVSFNLESREYNERWYTDIRAWKIESLEGGSNAAAPRTSNLGVKKQDDGDPFANVQGEEDLPF